jgi:hypothetical protein
LRRNKKREPDYEGVVPVPFADERLDWHCCYCGASRINADTTKDHVPSIGLFDDDPPRLLPTVRVCRKCNQSHSSAELYAYCAISVALSGSPRPIEQLSPVARRVLENDKRLRRIVSTSFAKNEDGHCSINIDAIVFSQFLDKQARGHVFLECSEVRLSSPNRRFWLPRPSMSEYQMDNFLFRTSDAFPEIGSRGFVRFIEGSDQLDDFEIDNFGFTILKRGMYRFRVVLSNGGIIVQSIIRDYLFTEIEWE